MSGPFVPDDAPFTPEQRTWLNGFFAAARRHPRPSTPPSPPTPLRNRRLWQNRLRPLRPTARPPLPLLLRPSQHRSLRRPPPAPIATSAPRLPPAAAEPESAVAVIEDSEEEADGNFPWHDPALNLEERMALAEGRKPERQLMAAMAQLDCGSCGYLCQTYSEAIASGADADITKCSPGGRETTKKLKELVQTLRIGDTVVNVGRPGGAERSDVAINTAFSDGTYYARLLRTVKLNADGSEKDVRHVEFDLRGTPLNYKVGDALGVVPENCNDAVHEVLEVMGASGAEDVPAKDGGGPGGHTTSFREALQHERMITKLTADLIEFLADVATDPRDAGRLLNMLVDETGAHWKASS